MNWDSNLENMERGVENNETGTEESAWYYFDNPNETKSFAEELEDKLFSCTTIPYLREKGADAEDLEETANIILQDLKDFLISHDVSEDEMEKIINQACDIMGTQKATITERHR